MILIQLKNFDQILNMNLCQEFQTKKEPFNVSKCSLNHSRLVEEAELENMFERAKGCRLLFPESPIVSDLEMKHPLAFSILVHG